MKKEGQPLAEVFGHPPTDFSAKANCYRTRKLCPFNNKILNCSKDKADDPLGVCSIHHQGAPAIICPTRFREDWLITDDAAEFFFPTGTPWTKLTEVRLKDCNGRSAGNIDVVLVAYDEGGIVVDFGALEIQAVKYGFAAKPIPMKNTHHAAMTELVIGRNLDWMSGIERILETQARYKRRRKTRKRSVL